MCLLGTTETGTSQFLKSGPAVVDWKQWLLLGEHNKAVCCSVLVCLTVEGVTV
jgi:hypothetical protein